jgi:hypothetical protein
MVKRQHGVRFTSAEVGLELHHRVAASTSDALQRAYEQPLEALGAIRSAENSAGFLYSSVPSPKCTCHKSDELGLLDATAGYVLCGVTTSPKAY